jgi:hypothetical protein
MDARIATIASIRLTHQDLLSDQSSPEHRFRNARPRGHVLLRTEPFKEMSTMVYEPRSRAAVNIAPDAEYQPARALRAAFGFGETTLQRLALAGVIRHATTTSIVTLYNREDVEKIARDKGRIPAALPEMSETK